MIYIIIYKLITKKYFNDIKNGNKKFEVRLNNFKCKKRDIIVLIEINNKGIYTGNIMCKKINYILNLNKLKFYSKEEIDKYGYQIIQFK